MERHQAGVQPSGKDAPRAAKVAYEVRNIAVINGPNFLPTDEQLRHRVETSTARSDYPQGGLRQFDAFLGTGSLLRFTCRITAPTIVVRGSHDPMMRIRSAATWLASSMARFIVIVIVIVIDGMGHDLAEPVGRPVVDALAENFPSD